MPELFPDISPSPERKESSDMPELNELLDDLKKNWEHLDTADRITRIQDLFDLAKKQDMEKTDFCHLAAAILNLSFTATQLFVDSPRSQAKKILDSSPPPENERVVMVLRLAKKADGEINPVKLRAAAWLAQKGNMSDKDFIDLAADILDCHPHIVGEILNDKRFSGREAPEGKTKLPPKPKQHFPKKIKKEPPPPPLRPTRRKAKPTKPKEPVSRNPVALELRNHWNTLEPMAKAHLVKQWVESKRSHKHFSLPAALNQLARLTNRSDEYLKLYYELSGLRRELLTLLDKELINVPTAVQIQSILNDLKNVDTEKLFKDLAEKNGFIDIRSFREILQGCLTKKSLDWKKRVTPCRIKKDWQGEGEVLKDYDLTYIPPAFLSAEERDKFHFSSHRNDVFVTFVLSGQERYSKVPIDALEPVCGKN